MNNFSDRSAMSEALSSLHRYIRSMYISVELPEIENSVLEEIFNSEDSTQLAQFEKMIGAAAISAIYDDNEIPKKFKAKVAARAAEELVDAVRGAIIEYKFSCGKFGTGQIAIRKYEREKKGIKLCRKAARLDKIKHNLPHQLSKQAAKLGVKSALSAGGFSVGGPIGTIVSVLVVDAICYLTPPKVKDSIKKKMGEIANKSRGIVCRISQRMKSSTVVQKAQSVVDTHVTPIIRPIYEKAQEALDITCAKIEDSLRKKWKAFKSWMA